MSAPDLCHPWTRAGLFLITGLNRGLHSRKRIACCAKLKPCSVRPPTWRRIPADGLQLGGGLTEANTGDFFVRLKPFPRRDIETVMDEVRQKVEREVPGLQIELAQLMEDLIGDLTAVPQPIEIKLYSDDGNLLIKLGPSVAAAIGKIPGVVDVKPGIVLAGDALNIQVDRVKASLEGVDPDTITQMVSNYLSGVVTTQIQSGSKMIGVRAWIPHDLRATQQSVEELRLRAADGHLFLSSESPRSPR